MSTPPANHRHEQPTYEIRVQGRLDQRWAAWFDGLTVTAHGDGTTALAGPIVDQAALHGLLQRLHDIGVPLISVTQIDGPAPAPSNS